MKYVTFDDAGALTGAYTQELQPAHAANYLEVNDVQYAAWLTLRANAARTGLEPAPMPAAPEPPVPQSVTPLQGLLAIDAAGFSVAYEAWAADPARTFSERAFLQKAQTWRRDDPLLQAATTALGLNANALDALFIAAAQL